MAWGGGNGQKVYADRRWRLVLRATEQLNGNMRASVTYSTREELVSRPNGHVLKVVQTPLKRRNALSNTRWVVSGIYDGITWGNVALQCTRNKI